MDPGEAIDVDMGLGNVMTFVVFEFVHRLPLGLLDMRWIIMVTHRCWLQTNQEEFLVWRRPGWSAP